MANTPAAPSMATSKAVYQNSRVMGCSVSGGYPNGRRLAAEHHRPLPGVDPLQLQAGRQVRQRHLEGEPRGNLGPEGRVEALAKAHLVGRERDGAVAGPQLA